jgi:hypothetical protein
VTDLHEAMSWCADNLAVIRWFRGQDGVLLVRVGVPTSESAVVIILNVGQQPETALIEAVDRARSEVVALDRRALLTLA